MVDIRDITTVLVALLGYPLLTSAAIYCLAAVSLNYGKVSQLTVGVECPTDHTFGVWSAWIAYCAIVGASCVDVNNEGFNSIAE